MKFIPLIAVIFAAANGLALPGNANTVRDYTCKGYELKTKVTTNMDLQGYFVINWSFDNDSFIATFTNFTSSYKTHLTLQSFSQDTGYQYCNVTTGVTPTPCTIKISKTRTYSLNFQLFPLNDDIILLTIITTKSNEIIEPGVSQSRECEGSTSTSINAKAKIDFCCIY